MFCLTWFVIFFMVKSSQSHGPHHPRGAPQHYRPDTSRHGTKLTQDRQLLQDQQHLKEDLGEWATNEKTRKMSPEELEFHYFKVHDFDNNTKLDGLEILHAIQHTVHDHEAALQDADQDSDDYHQFVEIIDRVLDEDDLDRDGYLSYMEYVLGREKDENNVKST